MTKYTVPRVQGTYADALTAVGLAKLLQGLGGDPTKIRLQSQGGQAEFSVLTPETPNLNMVNGIELFPYIRVKGDEEAPPGCFDYEKESQDRSEALTWKKNNKSLRWEDAPEGINPPRTDWAIHQAIYSLVYRANSPVHKLAYRQITGELCMFHVKKILSEFGGENHIDLAGENSRKQTKPDGVVEKVTALQLFNPTKGMGVWAKKPNDAKLRNIDSPIYLEILKFSGWRDSSHAVEIFIDEKGQKRDIKVFVIEPMDISISDLSGISILLRDKAFLGKKNFPIKYDILVALSLAEVILKYNENTLLRRGRASRIISGFHTVTFQQLGKAKSSMSQAFIALPTWINIKNDEDRKTWLTILEEHRQIIRNLDESHSEERNLLERYRDFLSGQDTRAFLEFLSDYGPHVMRMYERLHGKAEARWKVRWFSEDHLNRVLKSMEEGKEMQKQERKLTAIIETPGFVNIAKAIRGATRNAVMAKKPMHVEGKPPRQPDRSYEIRYGLAQDLKRAAVTKEKFLAALSSFIADYNAENLRVYERRFDRAIQKESPSNLQRRVDISTDDLMEVAALLDEHDPQTVAMLLIAYGYSKTKREQKEDGGADSDSQQVEEMTAQQEAQE